MIQYKSWRVFKSVFLKHVRKASFTAYPAFCIFNAVADNHCYLHHVDLRLTCLESLMKGYEQFEIDILLVTRLN